MGMISLIFALALLHASKAMVVAQDAQVSLYGQTYAITVATNGPFATRMAQGHVFIVPVAGTTVCADGLQEGQIKVSGRMSARQQAKALLHETVHVAVDCDQRALPIDERIAQDVADLLASPEGAFILEGLRQ